MTITGTACVTYIARALSPPVEQREDLAWAWGQGILLLLIFPLIIVSAVGVLSKAIPRWLRIAYGASGILCLLCVAESVLVE